MESDEVLAGLRDCLATAGSPLPQPFTDLRVPEMAEVVNQLSLVEAAEVIRRLPLPLATTLCDFPGLRRRAMICEELTPELAASILEGISSDERTHIVRRMSPRECHRLLPKVSDEVRKEVEQLLQYPPRTAGGIMTTEFVRLEPEMTVQQALDRIRTVAVERESIYACYVLEPVSGHLLGALSLRDLVMADPGRRTSEIMRRKPVTVRVLEPQEEVVGLCGCIAPIALDRRVPDRSGRREDQLLQQARGQDRIPHVPEGRPPLVYDPRSARSVCRASHLRGELDRADCVCQAGDAAIAAERALRHLRCQGARLYRR